MNPPTTHVMYFAALLCPAEIDKKILELKHYMRDQYGCSAALKSPAHITLVPPFWLETEQENSLLQALDEFRSDIGELQIRLNGFSHFGKRVLFIDVEQNPALEEIRNQAEAHFINRFGEHIEKDDRPFHPHVTIATRDLKPSDFTRAWAVFSKKKFLETFPVKTISLLKLSPGQWHVIAGKRW